MRNATVVLIVCIILPACATSAPPHDPEARVRELGLVLQPPAAPLANYVDAVRSGNLLFLAGKVPRRADGSLITGKVGSALTVEGGYEAARITAVNQLAVLKQELGDLRRVRRIVKVLGFVNCEPSFTQHPRVINGFSDLMVEVFGERGRHARSSVAAPSLPMDAAVEVEMIVEVD